ncbi:MAG: alpha/beta fold hydrolase [Parahaliea sp.]
MSVYLHSTTRGRGPDVVLLHGLFGMGSNLGMLARALQDTWRVHCLDLPNHGRSDWLDTMSLASLAGAISDWMDEHSIADVRLVGHSLGGKVAMWLALAQPMRVSRLVVADIAPVAYPPHHDDIFQGLHAVAAALPPDRASADEILAQYIDETPVRQFLLCSLVRDEKGLYRWRFNLQGLEQGYHAVSEELDNFEPCMNDVLFLKGEHSNYILPEYRKMILRTFPRACLKVLPDTGHWLHAEQPRLFNAQVRRFLDKAPG